MNTSKQTLTVAEVAEILRISTIKTYEMARNQEFPIMKIGRTFRIPSEPFYNWLNGNSKNFTTEVGGEE